MRSLFPAPSGRLPYPAQCPRCGQCGKHRNDILHTKECALKTAWGQSPWEPRGGWPT